MVCGWKNLFYESGLFSNNFQYFDSTLKLLQQNMFGGGFRGFDGFGGFGDEDAQDEANVKKEVDNNKYYELIGVQKTATTEEIRKAFRKKALKEHPDKGGDPDKFKDLSNAYEVLSNPEKRQLYDDYGEQGVKNGGPPGGGGFGGLFDMFSGRGRKPSGPRKGKPKLIQMTATLEEVFNGTMKTVKIKRTRICEPCEGKGGKNVQKCAKCKGQGLVTKLVQLGPGMYSQSQAKCPDCKGQGEIMKEEDRCKSCKGEKVIEVEKDLEVHIESGCPNEHDYIFTGEHNEYPGTIAGDVYVRIKIKKHPVYERRGADLIHIKKISLLEALTGVTLDLPHLDGKKYTIATAPGEVLHNQELKTIKNLGMPFYKDPMSHGNLYIEFIVNFPKKNQISGANLQKIAKILNGKPLKSEGYSKVSKNKILEDFSENDLNESPAGITEEEEMRDRFGGGGRQEVRCQQQ